MILNFIFSHVNVFLLGAWILFLIFIMIRFFRPDLVKNISYKKLILIALGINIFYGLFVSWGQYHVWATAGDFTRNLINLPLPKEVPMNRLFEWTRPLFENNFGFFLNYVLGRVWLNILITFSISGVVYLLFRLWKYYRGGFIENGPELILVLMLISGWPGVLTTISLGFAFSVLLFIISYFRNKKILVVEPIFIFATLFSLLFTNVIVRYML